MKVNWLPATILTLLVFLVPLTMQESQSGPTMQASALFPACDRNSVSASCCDCCLVCDAVAVEDICLLLCAATAAVPQPTTSIAVLRDRRSPWSRAAGRVRHANPPEPHPPRHAFVVFAAPGEISAFIEAEC